MRRHDNSRRSVWWWTSGSALLIAVIAALTYIATLPSGVLERADRIGSVGSLVTGLIALLISIVSLRLAVDADARPVNGTRDMRPLGRKEPDTALAGTLPPIWNVSTRNPAFVGRDRLLQTIRQRLITDRQAAVQVLYGIGGVGKTHLVVEYAHRFAADYDLVWWIDAENTGLIGDQYASLAVEANLVGLTQDVSVAVSKVKAYLRGKRRWLLVFDNVEGPVQLREWLPGGPGHVIVTSRNPAWGEVAQTILVEEFARSESITLLLARLPALARADADTLADSLGDLPLAIAQAASMISETGMSVDGYRIALAAAADRVLDESPSPSYYASLSSITRLAASRLSADNPAAGQMLQLCALLAPESVPVSLFSGAPVELLPQPLREAARSSLAFHQAIGRVVRYGLAQLDGDGLRLHRLTQAILRRSLSTDMQDETRTQAELLLVASRPDDAQDSRQWPVWARLVPHILALDPVNSANPALRDLACDMAWYLLFRGDTRFGLTLARSFYEQWRAEYGPDDRDSLEAASILARAYRDLGIYSKARQLDEDVYERRRRIYGRDHPDTLAVANNLAISLRALGEVQAARELDEDNLVYHQQNDGENHPDTLRSAINLAADLRELRDVQAARKLDEDTLVMMRRVLGDDHLHTLRLANYLAEDLRVLGDVQAARALDEDTLTRMRRVLGDDHPYTLYAASGLAEDLRRLGDVRAAEDLDQDTLARMRRVLGDDHPETLRVADNLRRSTDTHRVPWYKRGLLHRARKRS